MAKSNIWPTRSAKPECNTFFTIYLTNSFLTLIFNYGYVGVRYVYMGVGYVYVGVGYVYVGWVCVQRGSSMYVSAVDCPENLVPWW